MDSLFKGGTHNILQIKILTFQYVNFLRFYQVSYFPLYFNIFREIIGGTHPPFHHAHAGNTEMNMLITTLLRTVVLYEISVDE